VISASIELVTAPEMKTKFVPMIWNRPTDTPPVDKAKLAAVADAVNVAAPVTPRVPPTVALLTADTVPVTVKAPVKVEAPITPRVPPTEVFPLAARVV
jgi:hypothetical protein